MIYFFSWKQIKKIKHRRWVLRMLYPKQHIIKFSRTIHGPVMCLSSRNFWPGTLCFWYIYHCFFTKLWTRFKHQYYVSVVALSLVSDVSFWSCEFLITSVDYCKHIFFVTILPTVLIIRRFHINILGPLYYPFCVLMFMWRVI